MDHNSQCSRTSVILVYVFALLLHMPVSQQYIYSKFCEKEGFPYQFSADESTCEKQLNHSMEVLQKRVQAASAHFQIGISLCNTLPSFVVCMYLGSWSDHVGRRPVIILCTFSAFLESALYLATIALDLPIYLMLVASFLNGLGGYFTGFLIAVLASIADTTDRNKRALRLGVMEAVIFLGGMASNFLSGYFIQAYGFVIPYTLVCCSFVSAFLYSIFILPESKTFLDQKPKSIFTKMCCKYPVGVWRTLSKPRASKWKIILIMPAALLVNMHSLGINSVIMLYILNSPFCLTPLRVGYFIGVRLLLMGVGAAVGIKIFGKVMSEYFIVFVGIFSYAAFYTLLAFGRTEMAIYIACVAGIFSGTVAPIFRGILSKAVGPDEQRSLFSFVSSLEMLSVFIGSFIFNALYPIANNEGYPGNVFFLPDVLLGLPFIFTIIYTIKIRAEKRKQRYDIDEILENEITNPCTNTVSPVHVKGYGSNDSSPRLSLGAESIQPIS